MKYGVLDGFKILKRGVTQYFIFENDTKKLD